MIKNIKLKMIGCIFWYCSLLKDFFIRLILPSRDEKFNDIHKSQTITTKSRAVRSANEHFFHAIPTARCYFPDEIERIDSGRQREADWGIETLREIFSLSSSVSFYLRGEFVEMRRTMKDARRIITLCFQQKLRILLSFHFSQSY